MRTFFSFILVIYIFTLAGCMPAGKTTTSVNDASRLDSMAQHDAQSAEFAQKAERYYQAIEKKDWPTTYDMRTSDFKQDVTRNLYLKQMADSSENLTSYKVLNVRMYGGASGDTAAELIMEFNEAGMVSYNCARWIKRDGIWLCDEPGLSGLLTSTRIPDWVTK
jgi:hypothetical protein